MVLLVILKDNMQEYKKNFIDFMIKSQALKFGEFTLKSGRTSPFFFNAGCFVTGSQLLTLARFYAQLIRDKFRDYTVLFGPAYKGIPIATAISITLFEYYGLDIKYSCNRKEQKDHGADKGSILGYVPQNTDKIIIVEDVTTSGASIEETLPIIKSLAPNSKVLGEVIMLDRQEKSPDSQTSAIKAIEEKYGFPVIPIITMSDVIDALYTNGNKKIITDDIKLQLDNYYKQWGV